jgi:hypothetical protein
MKCSDITKLYKQVVLVLGHEIPGAMQEIEAFNYVHLTSSREVDDDFSYNNIHNGKRSLPSLGCWGG